MKRSRLLLMILQSYAPSDEAERLATEVYDKMVKQYNEPEDILERQLVMALHDGIEYGNWPWTMKGKDNG